jgi:hypothetical protein
LENKTNVALAINNPVRAFSLVRVTEDVPKILAQSAREIEFKTFPTEIVRDDPIIRWDLEEFKPGEERKIEYSVNRIPPELTSLIYFPLRELTIVYVKFPSGFNLVNFNLPSLEANKFNTLSFTVRNTEDVPHNFSFSMKLPEGWEMHPPRIEEAFAPQEEKTYNVGLFVPKGTETGRYVVIAEFVWDNDAVVREYTATVATFISLVMIAIVIVTVTTVSIIATYMTRSKPERRGVIAIRSTQFTQELQEKLRKIRKSVERKRS